MSNATVSQMARSPIDHEARTRLATFAGASRSRTGAFGHEILTTPFGTWRWDSVLGDFNYWVKGSRRWRPDETHWPRRPGTLVDVPTALAYIARYEGKQDRSQWVK